MSEAKIFSLHAFRHAVLKEGMGLAAGANTLSSGRKAKVSLFCTTLSVWCIRSLKIVGHHSGEKMGEYAMNCAVSGLPIDGGTEVRALLLTQNPYEESRYNPIEISDMWRPRTVPMKAIATDYGSISNWDESAAKTWLEMFQFDLHEVGIGENRIHDVSMRKTHDFPRFLTALCENRVFVRKCGSTPSGASGVALDSVRASLRELGLNVLDPAPFEKGPMGFIVDAQPTYVRVRVNDEYSRLGDLSLEELFPKIKNFYRRVTLASGLRGGREIQIPYDVPQEDVLRVKLALIREDVWKRFCCSGWDERGNTVFAGTQKNQIRECSRRGQIPINLDQVRTLYYDRTAFRYWDDVGTLGVVAHLGITNSMGLADDRFLDAFAEFQFIQSLMYLSRRPWSPSYSCGPWTASWDSAIRYLDLVSDIAKENGKKKRSKLR